MDFHYLKSQNLNLAKALSLEWLETNGLGGYASSSIINCHTRKYHGLLVSKIESLPDKYVLLSKVEDIFLVNEQEYYLSAHQYPNHFQDGSFTCFQEFVLDTHPHFKYKFHEIEVEKELLLLHEANTLLIKYTIKNDNNLACKIKLRPFFAYRNFHALAKKNSSINTDVISWLTNRLEFTPYCNMPSLFLQSSGNLQFQKEPLWYNNFVYDNERIRGYECLEDLFTPGVVTLAFNKSHNNESREIIIACSLDEQKQELAFCFREEIERRKNLRHKLASSPFQRQLQKTGLSFIQRNPQHDSFSIVAGYHWFLEWGRDAMISLPGLTLYSGLEDQCLMVLKEFARHEHQGLIPNFIGTAKEQNAYNSVDASLWFAWAAQQYCLKVKDTKEVFHELWSTLKNIFKHYKNGTLYNIKMSDNGLLYAGSADVNLTWMDAMVNGHPVTPRYGYQVEINALWFNMLSFMHELAELHSDPIKYEIAALLPKIRLNFCQAFWDIKMGYLYDFVNQNGGNEKFRPNQLFAVSLPYSPLPKDIALRVMEKVQQELLTPYGLRTLSPKDSDYRATYTGSQEGRDAAYHNGTVWPWLLGHFGEALLKVYNKKKVIEIMRPSLVGLKVHLSEAGIGSIAEIFNGDAPYHPNGCISQAWSVAEVLRLTYLLGIDSGEVKL